MFKQNHKKNTNLDLKKVILLDKCSTMDLFYHSNLVGNITKAKKNMTVKDNGGTLVVTHTATVSGYKEDVWFIKYSITNLIYLKNFIKQYRLTYDSIDKICVVHM